MKNWSFLFIEGCIALKSVLKYLLYLLKLFELNAVLFKDTKPMMMTYLIRQNLFGLTNNSAMFRSSWKSLRKLKLKFPKEGFYLIYKYIYIDIKGLDISRQVKNLKKATKLLSL